MTRFGRLHEFDEKSRAFNIRSRLEAEYMSAVWDLQLLLNQDGIGACVGFTDAYELASEPFPIPNVTNETGFRFYVMAQARDQYVETPPMEGSSILGGVKALKDAGYVVEYRWSFNTDDAIRSTPVGPGLFGCNWYWNMDSVDARGFIHPSGGVAGGHAIFRRGWIKELGATLLHNSWGPWGINFQSIDTYVRSVLEKYGVKPLTNDGWTGCALLSDEDFDRLLREEGELCIPILRADPGALPVDDGEDTGEEKPGCLEEIRQMFKRNRGKGASANLDRE